MGLKLLIVEDDAELLNTCTSSQKRYIKETGREIELVVTKNLEEALAGVDNSFDGAIVDLKLDYAGTGDEGSLVIKKIHSEQRIPVAIYTGTPMNADPSMKYIGIYTKGETEYIELFNIFYGIYSTGLTKITGGRGVIESTMSQVFQNNILPQWKTWVDYATSGKNTEKALLRFTINHLMELLDDDGPYFPEEMYIKPPISSYLRTGSIVQNKSSAQYHIVLTPACDLVIRDGGKCKTDYVKVCEIEKFEPLRDEVINGVSSQKQPNMLKKLLKNTYNEFYHWLPSTNDFSGGFINFRKSRAVPVNTFADEFGQPETQITSHFIKDIVHRFSVFHARQGQPDFNFQELSNLLLPKA